jgi:hypothetical protein
MKFRVLATLFVLILTGFSVFAQEAGNPPASSGFKNESEFYPVIVPVEKVYVYTKGYVVTYRKGPFQTVSAYIPLEWFSGAAAKAELVRQGSADNWPSLVVYYKNGEFSHLRLYVHRDRTHETWGTAISSKELDSRFENVEEIKLEF